MALKRLQRGNPPGQTQAITETRIEAIAAKLRDCSFRNGVTLREFAAEWGISMDMVHDLSSRASRRVRAEVTDPDRVASKGFAMLEKIADDALNHADVDEENAAGHRAVAIKAVDTWITKSGVAAPTKAVVGVTGDLSALTDEQLEERKRAVLARLGGGLPAGSNGKEQSLSSGAVEPAGPASSPNVSDCNLPAPEAAVK